jgi:hypothetical protein
LGYDFRRKIYTPKIILTHVAYPNLKSDAVVANLMDELAGISNRIEVARTQYNDRVRDFNKHSDFS